MKIKTIGHLVNVGKTKPNKPKVKIGKMNLTSFITMNYEQRTMNDEKNKAKQTQTKPISNVTLQKRNLTIYVNLRILCLRWRVSVVKMQKIIKYAIFKTRWGYFGLAGTENGLLRTHLPSLKSEKIKSQLLKNLKLVNRASSFENQVYRIEFDKIFFKAIQERIAAYFDGACINLSNISIVLDGFSFFVTSVLTACRNIEFGRTISYSGLAKKLGRTTVARALGAALAKNPLPLIIPCHRVVRKDGKIGGFSAPGGKELKAKLLKHEHTALTHRKSL